MNNTLAEIRENIDKIDDQLVELLALRIYYALEALKYKKNEAEIRGCDRVQIVLDKVKQKALAKDAPSDTIVNIYKAIISELTELQLKKYTGQKVE